MGHKLRITQVVHDFHPTVGGIETYSYNLAKGLVDAGHYVKVYTALVPGRKPREVWEGIEICRLRSVVRPFSYPFMPGLIPTLTRDGCDILHAHINSPMTVDFTAFSSRLVGIPLVITYHADALITDIASRTPILRRWLSQVYWLSRHIAASIASKILITSPLYLEISEFLQRYRDKTSVIPAVVDPYFLSPLEKTASAKAAFGYSPEELLILFVGRLVPYKGLNVLLRAFRRVHKQIPEARLAIVGTGPELPRLQRIIQKQGLEKVVKFHMHLTRENLRKAYSACDVFVLPSRSRSEAFGIVLLEAMARGKPVVATHVGGVPYVVNDHETGLLVPPYDPVPLSNAISLMLTNYELREQFGIAARDRVEKQFRRERVMRQLEQIYFDLLK